MSTAPKRARILVVDDEHSMREFLTICLGRAGHDVVAVGGGAEAMARIDAEAFELVITDLTMPQVGGMDVLRHAMRRHNLQG